MKVIELAVTHNGEFHLDETLATVILRAAFGNFRLIRTRDKNIIEDPKVDIVYDVGKMYDGVKWFDHHQINKKLRQNGIPYSACGLIWKHFGHKALVEKGVPIENINDIWTHMDEHLVYGADAIDNGEWKRSEIPLHNIAGIVSDFNLTWDSIEDEDEAFEKAVDVVTKVFDNIINDQLAVIRARHYVQQAFVSRDRKEVLILEKGCNWKKALLEVDVNEEVLFVVFPDKHEGYRIQNVPVREGPGIRKSLPSAWKDATEKRLNQIIGIDDALFCAGRYIAGAKSMSSIRKMAQLAIAQ